MSLVRVLTDVGGPKPIPLLAKITHEHDDGQYTIQYFSPTDDRDRGRVVYRYEDETYMIDDESVMEYLNTDDEISIGYRLLDDGISWVRDTSDSDDDYVPSDEEDDASDEEDDASDEEECVENEEEGSDYYADDE